MEHTSVIKDRDGQKYWREHFGKIKGLFFPCWDRRNLWRISTKSRRTGCGSCDIERRVIELMSPSTDPDSRDTLLIHEICHAVADGSHGKQWQRRMQKAAAIRATELKRDSLAQLLRQEILAYRSTTTSQEIQRAYCQIEDAVLVNPSLTLPQVKRWLAWEYGLLPSEVYKRFRRTRRVFADAKKMAAKLSRADAT